MDRDTAVLAAAQFVAGSLDALTEADIHVILYQRIPEIADALQAAAEPMPEASIHQQPRDCQHPDHNRAVTSRRDPTDEPTPDHPRYDARPATDSNMGWLVACDEGWRTWIVGAGMYPWCAVWLAQHLNNTNAVVPEGLRANPTPAIHVKAL